MKERIAKLLGRLEEVEGLLGQPDVVQDKNRYRELTQEHSYLSSIKEFSSRLNTFSRQLKESLY